MLQPSADRAVHNWGLRGDTGLPGRTSSCSTPPFGRGGGEQHCSGVAAPSTTCTAVCSAQWWWFPLAVVRMGPTLPCTAAGRSWQQRPQRGLQEGNQSCTARRTAWANMHEQQANSHGRSAWRTIAFLPPCHTLHLLCSESWTRTLSHPLQVTESGRVLQGMPPVLPHHCALQ